MLHPRIGLLVVKEQAAVFVDDIAAVPATLVAQDGHQSRHPAALKGSPYRAKFHRQERIAVDDQERFTEDAMLVRQAERPARAAKLFAFVHVADGTDRRRLRFPIAVDHLALVPDAI